MSGVAQEEIVQREAMQTEAIQGEAKLPVLARLKMRCAVSCNCNMNAAEQGHIEVVSLQLRVSLPSYSTKTYYKTYQVMFPRCSVRTPVHINGSLTWQRK